MNWTGIMKNAQMVNLFFFFFSSFLGAESEACKTGALSSNVLKMKYL